MKRPKRQIQTTIKTEAPNGWNANRAILIILIEANYDQ